MFTTTPSRSRTPHGVTACPSRSRGVLQRSCACGGTPGPTGECAQCRRKRLGLQRESTSALARGKAPRSVHGVIRSGGRPLDDRTRTDMESRLGFDFGGVRIHTDTAARESASQVDARAYTVGNHVVFGEGAWVPDSAEGRRLLAHELVHVMQQADMGYQSALEIGQPGDRFEVEADRMSARAMDGGVMHGRGAEGGVQQSGAQVSRLGGKCLTEKIAYWSSATAMVASCGGAILTSETGIGLILLGAACVASIGAYIASIISLANCMESDPDADRREIERLRAEQEAMERRLRQVEEMMGQGSSDE